MLVAQVYPDSSVFEAHQQEVMGQRVTSTCLFSCGLLAPRGGSSLPATRPTHKGDEPVLLIARLSRGHVFDVCNPGYSRRSACQRRTVVARWLMICLRGCG